MGTSNWQNVPFCVEVLMKIAPQRVLDVGVGFGRWGIAVREFCDVWYGRVSPDQWSVRVDGIEAFPPNVAPYHRHFYDHIHVGDAAELLPGLGESFDVIIFGDVLEHFPKDVGRRLLDISLQQAGYVLVNLPLGEDWSQDEAYANPFERHLASWTLEDLQWFPVVRSAVFQDHVARPFASVVLSRQDAKGVGQALFSRATSAAVDGDSPGLEATMQRTLQLASEVRHELAYIKQSASYRLASRLRQTPLWNLARWVRTRNEGTLHIRALGRPGEGSQGTQVWLLGVHPYEGGPAVPWDFLEMPSGSWYRRDEPGRPYGQVVMGNGGRLRLPLYADDPLLTFMTHPWSGLVEVTYRDNREVIDLYTPTARSVEVRPARRPMIGRRPPAAEEIAARGGDGTGTATTAAAVQPRFTPEERRWLERIRAENATSVAIYVPRWLGIASATRTLFTHLYPLPSSSDRDPATVDPGEVAHHAEVLLESGIDHFVCSGGERAHYDLLRAIKERKPGVRCDLLWHGTYVQCQEDYAWSMLKLWVEAARDGWVHSIGTVKKGMERFFASNGCRSKFIMNYVDAIPAGPSAPDAGGPHVGIWISGYSYRKLPFAMLAALKMVPGATLRASNITSRGHEVVGFFDIGVSALYADVLPEPALLQAIKRTHVTAYVTFSECCPMLPLQSLSVGVPCLTGPTSHLFEDNDLLHDRLVVPYPDRADVIADYLQRCVEERGAIIAEYARYAAGYNDRARASVLEFLS